MIRYAAALLMVTLAACDQEDPAADLVKAGNEAFEKREYGEAIALYNKAAAFNDGAPEITYNLATVHARSHKLDLSKELLTSVLDTERPATAAKIHYNLGVVDYRKAHEALQTFQDAKTFVTSAIRSWRTSLSFDPNQPDVRYNLELAYRLSAAIDAQEVQAQQNADTRDQKTSDNRGQAFENEEDRPDQKDSEHQMQSAELSNHEAGTGRTGNQTAAPSRQVNAMQEANKPNAMSQQDATETLEMLLERARAAERQHQAQQQRRILAVRPEKYW